MPSPDQEGSLSTNANRRFRAALVAALILVPGGSVPAAAQEDRASGWSQFQGGPGHPGILEDGPPPPYTVRWTFPAPRGEALSGAVIVEDVVVTVGEKAVFGVDVATGETAWQAPRAGGPLSIPAVATGNRATLLYLDGPEEGDSGTPASGTPSPSSPAPSATSTGSPSPEPSGSAPDEDRSFLVALDLADRAERWRTPLGAVSRTGVTVEGDTAYVGDDDGTIYAIAIRDGRIRWTNDLGEGATEEEAAAGECARLSGARVDVPIAVADGRVIVVGRDVGGGAVAVSAHAQSSGDCLWREFPQIGSAASSVAAARDGIVVVGLADRLVRGLGGQDGEQRWTSLALSLFSPASSPAFASEALYVSDLGGGLYRLDPRDGDREWSFQFNEVVLRSSPVVSGTAVLLGLDDGRLVAVDVASGHLVWESAPSPGAVGALALGADVVVAAKGGPDAGLVAFEHDPEGRLVDTASPTVLEPLATLSRVGGAAVIVLAVVLVPGILARRRFGDAFADGDVEGEPEPDEMEES